MKNIIENAIEIAWIYCQLNQEGQLQSWDEISKEHADSSAGDLLKEDISDWAEEFEDGYDESGDYITAITDFATSKLIAKYGRKCIEKRRITAESLRTLCIIKNWYTRGNCQEYEHLMYDLAEKKANITTEDIVTIARDIMAHSDIDCDLKSVCFEVAKIATTSFIDVGAMKEDER